MGRHGQLWSEAVPLCVHDMMRQGLLTALSRWRIEVATVAVVPLLALAHPRPAELVGFLPVVGVGLALRTWAQGHLERRIYLTQTGPYAHIRHPLYVGSFLIGLGLSLMVHVTALPVVYACVFVVMYWPKMLREEHFQHARWGGEWQRYASRTGAVLPGLHAATSDEGSAQFAWSRVRRSGEWKTWLGALIMLTALVIRTHVR
jgi:protein-S-isoprenylcysteine O-methyltransferase Ste14